MLVALGAIDPGSNPGRPTIYSILFKVEATLSSCSPEIGDELKILINVNGGATSFYMIKVRTLDIGSVLMFN